MTEWRAELSELSLLRLRKAYQYGVEIHKELEKNIERTPIFPHDAGVLSQIIYDARHSDHVEIGTFYGGSAILAALVKKEFKMHGKIYCVDPLECRPGHLPDKITEGTASTVAVMTNAKKFGVEDRLVLVPQSSYPWPLGDKSFGTGYIDGDHWNGMPLNDWNSLRKCVSYAIIFDDYVMGKSEVIQTVTTALQDPAWLLIHASGTSAVLRRRQ